MALQSVSFSKPGVDPGRNQFDRQRRIAEALQAQAFAPEQTQMAGGYAIPQGILSPVSKIAQAWAAKSMGERADRGEQDYAREQGARRAEAIARAMQAGAAAPAQPAQDMGQDALTGEAMGVPAVPARGPDPQAIYRALAGTEFPELQQAGMAGMLDAMKPKNPVVVGRTLVNPQTGETVATDSTWQAEQDAARQAREQEAAARREERRQELEARLQDARISREERAALQRELQQNQLQARQDMVRLAASMRPPAQPPQPQIVQTDSGPMVMDRSGNARPIMGPDGQPVKGKSTEKALPTSAAQKLMENQQNLRRAEQALALVTGENVGEAKGDKNATGWKGFVPNTILNIADPAGVDARAAIADLGSLVIHDRSGAAVTAAEFPRLRPFIPAATDDAATVQKKLRRFVDEYRKTTQEAGDFYKESGYKVPTNTLQPSGASGSWDGTDRRAAPRPGGRVVVDY